MDDVPLCPCHGEPMRWHKDSRYTAGGYTYCAVRSRDQQRRSYQKNREATRARQRPRDLAYWHRADGGYIRSRKRELAAARQQIIARLTHLQQEAEDLAQ